MWKNLLSPDVSTTNSKFFGLKVCRGVDVEVSKVYDHWGNHQYPVWFHFLDSSSDQFPHCCVVDSVLRSPESGFNNS